MSTSQMKVLVPEAVPAPRMASAFGIAAAWLCRGATLVAEWIARPPRGERDLRALAQEVASEQPVLAAELRGIAMHWEAIERTAR